MQDKIITKYIIKTKTQFKISWRYKEDYLALINLIDIRQDTVVGINMMTFVHRRNLFIYFIVYGCA